MRRIDRYWKRCAAGMMAALMLMTAGEGGFTSFGPEPQFPFKIVDQAIQTQEGNVSASQSAPVTTAAFGTVTTPVTDASSYFGAGRMTMLANHDTRAQQLAVIIENGAGGLIVVDRLAGKQCLCIGSDQAEGRVMWRHGCLPIRIPIMWERWQIFFITTAVRLLLTVFIIPF